MLCYGWLLTDKAVSHHCHHHIPRHMSPVGELAENCLFTGVYGYCKGRYSPTVHTWRDKYKDSVKRRASPEIVLNGYGESNVILDPSPILLCISYRCENIGGHIIRDHHEIKYLI